MKRLFGALLLGAGLVSTASAATISSVVSVSLPGPSTGSIGPVGVPPSPNNDNTSTASANAIPASTFFNAVGTAEYEFVVANSGGTTEYMFTQAAINNSGQTWSGFRFELGYGTSESFTSTASIGGVNFDFATRDPAPLSPQFTVLDHQAALLGWSGATVPSIGSVFFSFAVDVPDGLESFNPSAQNRFTLRATPVLAATPIPEPATVLAPLRRAGAIAAGFEACHKGLVTPAKFARSANVKLPSVADGSMGDEAAADVR